MLYWAIVFFGRGNSSRDFRIRRDRGDRGVDCEDSLRRLSYSFRHIPDIRQERLDAHLTRAGQAHAMTDVCQTSRGDTGLPIAPSISKGSEK